MRVTWIVLFARSKALIYSRNGIRKDLSLVVDLDNREALLQNRELESDRHGATISTSGTGMKTLHPVAESKSHDHVVDQFAKEVAELLERGRNENKYHDLVLVAEPRALGILKGALDKNILNMIVATVPKELIAVESRELPEYLEEAVRFATS